LKLVNCYHDFQNVYLISRTPEGGRETETRKASFDAFTPAGERITFKRYADRKQYAQANPGLLEADVMPPRRIISDTPEIQIQAPRICQLDLESDSRVPFSRIQDMRILCYALADSDGFRKVNLLKSDTDHDERMLLRELMTDLEPYDAVSGWNLGSSWDERKMVNGQWVTIPGEGFDAPLLRARMRRLATDQRALERFMQQWLWSDFMQLYKRANTAAASGEEKQSYRLDHVARMVLGEGKHDFDSKECWEYWSAGGAKRQKMADYCLRDTEILVELEAKRNFIALYQAITSVCHGFLDTHGIKPTELIDGIMLRMGAEMGYRFPTKPSFYPTRNKFPGAYVMEPQQTGIIRDVHVADFAALYPSIFITWNMSPETKGKAGCVAPTTGVTFAKAPKGMLPMALEKLLDLRGEWKKKAASLPPGTPEWKEADRMSTALKVAANGFYGCVGSKYSRFYDREIAESVTQTGVFLIKQTLAAAEAA
jgi:hypothetical protein